MQREEWPIDRSTELYRQSTAVWCLYSGIPGPAQTPECRFTLERVLLNASAEVAQERSTRLGDLQNAIRARGVPVSMFVPEEALVRLVNTPGIEDIARRQLERILTVHDELPGVGVRVVPLIAGVLGPSVTIYELSDSKVAYREPGMFIDDPLEVAPLSFTVSRAAEMAWREDRSSDFVRSLMSDLRRG